ncbi:MAG: sigma-70 family RNA polymerase sigma factor [Gemmatimonadetes bacterium]|nr:sigma-70 family RNA polymerase sigma factor [Gemmatimonadota bacterium]
MEDVSPITRSLRAVRDGDQGAFESLVGLLYDDLRALAAHHLDRNAAHRTLSPTGLVHEAYLRLASRDQLEWNDRTHFFAACSVVMRGIVIDFARQRAAKKRGGGAQPLTLLEADLAIDNQAEELLALDRALDRLDSYGERLRRVVECRFFAGLTEPETAAALDVSERTVRRDWVKARALLSDLLADGDAGAPA